MKELQIGMIGLDTSHALRFGECFHAPDGEPGGSGARIAKAFPGGSRTFALSRDRVGEFTREMKEAFGVAISDSLDELAGLDGYLLESVDGTQHLEQFEILSEFGRPVFIDKPLACSYADALAIFDLAVQKNIPLMTCSCMRYAAGVGDVLPESEPVLSAEGFGPLVFLPDYHDYFWYGIHTAELIYHYLGAGCEAVRTVSGQGIELVIGRWKDGRIGQISGYGFGGSRFGVRLVTENEHRISMQNPDVPYMQPLALAVLEFFRTGRSPVDPVESLEVIAFLEAASRSRKNGGEWILLEEPK